MRVLIGDPKALFCELPVSGGGAVPWISEMHAKQTAGGGASKGSHQ